MRMPQTSGVTMMELMIVIVIIGILASLGIVSLINTKERTVDKEAINNLILLSAAQRDYHLDTNSYYDETSHAAIRRELGVKISSEANRLWDYQVHSSGCVNATRNGGSKQWALPIDDADGNPNEGAVCS